MIEDIYNRLPVRLRPTAKRGYRLLVGDDGDSVSHRKSIGHALGNVPQEWQRDEANPVLEPSTDTTDWDGATVEDPDVIWNDEFLMVYAGHGEYAWETKQIGVARSDDGVTWSKQPGNPILGPGEEGHWDDRSVQNPTVVFYDNTYHMIYDGSKEGYGWNGLGYAYSDDGVHWEKHDTNPVVALSDEGRWDSEHVADPHLMYAAGQFHIFYAGMLDGHWQIGHATSEDLIHWRKDSANPVVTLNDRPEWNYVHVNDPTVIELDGRYHMLHAGHGDDAKRFEHAISDDLTNWVSSGRPVFEPDPNVEWEGARLTNPSLVSVGDGVHLYYTGQTGSA